MDKTARILFLSALVAVAACGQVQVATVSSPSTFTLRGAPVNPGQGVPDWPVLAGDTLKAGQSPVKLVFADGSTITLRPGAEATVVLSGQTPLFQLLKGTADYSLKTPTSVQLASDNHRVAVASLTGTLGTTSRSVAPIAWVASHPVAFGVAGAAAVAGMGVGVAHATSGGTSVSPSR